MPLQQGFIRAYYKDHVGNTRSRTYSVINAKLATSQPELEGIATAFIAGITDLVGAEVTQLEVGGIIAGAAGAPIKPMDTTDFCSVHSTVKVKTFKTVNPELAKTVEFLGCYRDIYKLRLGGDKKTVLPVNYAAAPNVPGEKLWNIITGADANACQFADAAGNAIDAATDGLHSTKESFTSPGLKEG